MNKNKSRIFGPDLIRFIAIFFVISVHFLLNNGFYLDKVTGIKMFIFTFMRWFFYIGVPLFLLLTGYLKRTKKIEKNYYKSIIPIILTYLFIATCCLIFRKTYLHETIGIIRGFVSIFNFTADGYSWYVEMFIGLFLMIPFLNVLYNGLDNKKNKQYLILTLLIMISISPLINFIEFRKVNLEIVPNWWIQLYPICYYFIGCYLNEYKVEINKKKGILILIAILLLQTVLSYKYNYNELFSVQFLGGYNNLITIVASVLIFLLLYKIETNNKLIRNVVAAVSILSFEMYLFSFIIDRIIYKHFNEFVHGSREYLKYYIVIVPLVFIFSYILSYLKKLLFNFIQKRTIG